MRRYLFVFLATIAIALSFTSCATIFGSSSYNAKVSVPDHPNAKITVNGQQKGNGEVNLSLKRKEANKLNITVEETGKEPQTFTFNRRKVRGVATFFTVLSWLGPIPVGIIVDASTGAWFKPDVSEPGVTKVDYKNYTYTLNYHPNDSSQKSKKTTTNTQSNTTSKADKLRELKQLYDEGVLTKDEYEKEKAKVLKEN